jgi:hypothetical protein
MSQQDLLELLEEGIENGRISPALAAFIAADVLGIEPEETEFNDLINAELATA